MAEWKISKKIFSKHHISHIPCGNHWVLESCDIPRVSNDNILVWCCGNCRRKAPDHIILQWKLLNGT